MKYLYKILRLFFCPHKYSILIKHGKITECGTIIRNYNIKECRFCNKPKIFNMTT